MAIQLQATRIKMPNMILISGNGRNVGKTFLSCKIIKHLSERVTVIGVKISPHFHECDANDILFKTADFIILKENKVNKKDSSLMKQAGAKQVFFVMATQKHLQKALKALKPYINKQIVVCESGGLIEIVEPGVFLFVKREKQKIEKNHLLKYSPQIVTNNGVSFNIDIDVVVQKITVNTQSGN